MKANKIKASLLTPQQKHLMSAPKPVKTKHPLALFSPSKQQPQMRLAICTILVMQKTSLLKIIERFQDGAHLRHTQLNQVQSTFFLIAFKKSRLSAT